MGNELKGRNRLVDIDKAKGFAIFLVVFGHIVATDVPPGNEWYGTLKLYIYKFHMPFFMFISGMIMAYTFPGIDNAKDYFKYVFKRLKRLAPGYLLFGALIYLGKVYMSKVFHVDNVPGGLLLETYNLFLIPSESAGGSLWFIYVLMEMYIVFPLIIKFLSQSTALVILFGMLVWFIPATNVLMLDRFCEYFIFFSIGIVIVRHYLIYIATIDRYRYLFIALFFLSFLSVSYFSAPVSKIIVGVFSVPAIHGIMRKGSFSRISFWDVFGKYTYSIYLMNTIFIGLAKGAFLKFIPWEGVYFLIVAPFLLVAGLYGPILLKKYIFVRFSTLDRITT